MVAAIGEPVHEDEATGNVRCTRRGEQRLILRRRDADDGAELRAERAEAGVPDEVADLGNGEVRRAQEVLCALDASLAMVFIKAINEVNGQASANPKA